MGFFGKLWSYISFKKQHGPNGEQINFNLKAMHTINKISLLMFTFAIVYVFFKWVVF
jgi:hypothetical protein